MEQIESGTLARRRARKNQTQQLAVVLPGERDCDDGLIRSAVEELNSLHSSMALEMACRMGEYVLRVFFNGDLKRYREAGRQHTSFRRLAGREDLQVSFSFLCTAVSVVEQMHTLPPAVAQKLPLSHHRLLLPIKEAQAKQELARWAADQGLSKRQLAARVRRYRTFSETPRRGRPPTPPLIRSLQRLRKTAEELLSVSGQEWSVEGFPDDQAAILVNDLERELKAVVGIVRTVRERLLARAEVRMARPVSAEKRRRRTP